MILMHLRCFTSVKKVAIYTLLLCKISGIENLVVKIFWQISCLYVHCTTPFGNVFVELWASVTEY